MDGKSFRRYFGAIVLGIGVVLIGFNYWHLMTCVKSSESHLNLEEILPSYQQRVLEVESQIIQNEILIKKLMEVLSEELLVKDKQEMEKLVKHSRDEAIKTALDLTKLATKQTKMFEFDERYQNAESLGNLIDEIFMQEASKTEAPYEYESSNELKFREGFDDYNKFVEEEFEEGEEEGIELEEFGTEKERIESCQGWKAHYNVIEGVSWGNLPYDLQKKWKAYNCDVFLGMASR